MTVPFIDFYHCMGHTYGTWLPGDPRGFRSRHHRGHCGGDYRNPPPRGAFTDLHDRSKRSMKRDRVELTEQQRRVALEAFINSLLNRSIPVIVGAIDPIHFHVLASFSDHNPRHWIGIAKKESSHFTKVAGCGIEGGFWAVRCKCLPIEDGDHFKYAAKYIDDHRNRNASVWNTD